MTSLDTRFPAAHPSSGATLDGVAMVTIDRAHVLNALDSETMADLVASLQRLDAEPSCRCIVLTSAGERAFAAGADIAEMSTMTAEAASASGYFERWDEVAAIGTPMIAAVRGLALGGGLELALACDIMIAATDAQLGHPEVRLGIIPGVGGTQRLTHAVGTSKAMELILSGRRLGAQEALALGLVAQVMEPDATVGAALELAAEIAAAAPLAVRAAKAAVRAALEEPLSEGIAAERAAFLALFDTEDKAEGMRAFVEKRQPRWQGR